MNDNKSELAVYKDNYLVEASYKLSLMEQRIMLFAISRLDPRNPQDTHSFHVSELLKFYPDIEPNGAYRALREAVYKLSERWVRTEDPEKIREFRWVESRTYFRDEGRIDIVFTKSIMPYLFQLENQFTKYQLANVANFRSTHSIRIYELLIQYKKLGKRELNIEDLKELLKVGDKYDRYDNFKNRVINPAITEINKKSDLIVSVEPIKQGRKITALRFIISDKGTSKTNKIKTNKPINNHEKKNESQEKTRLIHGVFEEIARPQVAKGSVAEGEWAVKNLSKVRKTLRERGIYSGGDLDNNLHTIPTEWLKVISKFAKICDRYLSRAVSDELFNRKESQSN